MKFRLVTLIALLGLAVAPLSLLAQTKQTPQTAPSSQVPCCPAQTGTTTTGIGGGGGGFVADLSPYGGWVWPQSFTDVGDFKGSQIWGVRGGIFATSGFEIGGNWYWNSHFQPRRSNDLASFAGDLGFEQGSVRAQVFEVEFTYNFGRRSLFGSTAVRPYIVGGAGNLRTNIKHGDIFVLNTRAAAFIPGATPGGLQTSLVNNNLQNVLPGINTSNGVAFVGAPTGTAVFVPNDVLADGNDFFTFSYGGGIKATRLWGPMGLFADFRGRTVPNFLGHSNTWPEINGGLNFSWGEK